MQELRNATFAHVAQDTIRRVGTSTFDHLHTNRSISFVLNAMVFNVVPTAVVTGLMAYRLTLYSLFAVW